MKRQSISSGSSFERDIGYSRAVVLGDGCSCPARLASIMPR